MGGAFILISGPPKAGEMKILHLCAKLVTTRNDTMIAQPTAFAPAPGRGASPPKQQPKWGAQTSRWFCKKWVSRQRQAGDIGASCANLLWSLPCAREAHPGSAEPVWVGFHFANIDTCPNHVSFSSTSATRCCFPIVHAFSRPCPRHCILRWSGGRLWSAAPSRNSTAV